VGWCPDGDFLRAAFSASRAQHVSDLHSKLALRPHHVWKYVDIQSLNAEIRRGKKRKKERKKKPQGGHKKLLYAEPG